MGCTTIQERYMAVPMTASESRTFEYADSIGGFLASIAGTISISRITDTGATEVIVAVLPVAVGFNRIPVFLGTYGGVVALGGGAAGSLLI